MSAVVTPGRIVAAEWGKAWNLRSVRWAAAVTVLVAVGLTAGTGGGSVVGAEGYGHSLAYLAGSGLLLAQLPLLVLGVLIGASDTAGGASATFLAVPRRALVVAARALVVAVIAATTAATALVASMVAAAVGPLGPGLALQADTARIVTGAVGVLTLMSVLSYAVGATIRRAVPAIVVVFALGLSELALMGAGQLGSWLPGRALTLVTASEEFLRVVDGGVGTAVVVAAAWATAVLVVAMVRTAQTDV